MQPSTLASCLGLTAIALGAGPAFAPAPSPFTKVVVPLGGAPQRVVIGDVDGDADLDLVVLSASTTAAGLTVLLNDGRGDVPRAGARPCRPCASRARPTSSSATSTLTATSTWS